MTVRAPVAKSLFTSTLQSPVMARNAKKGSPTRSGKAKPAKSVPRAKGAVPRKAARKAPSKAKSPSKARRPAAKKTAAPRHDAQHESHMKEIRARVARRRPGQAPQVPHEQQDPSIVAPPAPPTPPVDHLHQNWGDAKQKGVTRLDKPTNWFRQAPKPPSK